MWTIKVGQAVFHAPKMLFQAELAAVYTQAFPTISPVRCHNGWPHEQTTNMKQSNSQSMCGDTQNRTYLWLDHDRSLLKMT